MYKIKQMLPNFGKLSFRSNPPRKTRQIDALGLEKAVISTHLYAGIGSKNFIDLFCGKLSFTRNTVKTAGSAIMHGDLNIGRYEYRPEIHDVS